MPSTSINELQVMQNATLRTTTGCTQDTNILHLHDETLTLPIHEHLQLHASQYKQKTQHQSHPLHKHTTYVTFIEVTFMLGCPHTCIIGHHIILPLVQPIGVSYQFVYTILIKTGHISNMKDGVIMCNNRNISLN